MKKLLVVLISAVGLLLASMAQASVMVAFDNSSGGINDDFVNDRVPYYAKGTDDCGNNVVIGIKFSASVTGGGTAFPLDLSNGLGVKTTGPQPPLISGDQPGAIDSNSIGDESLNFVTNADGVLDLLDLGFYDPSTGDAVKILVDGNVVATPAGDPVNDQFSALGISFLAGETVSIQFAGTSAAGFQIDTLGITCACIPEPSAALFVGLVMLGFVGVKSGKNYFGTDQE